MPQSKEQKKSYRRKNYSPRFKIPEPKPRILQKYSVGVYFPDRHPLTFYVTAHHFEWKDGNLYFSFIDKDGVKDFSACFTHVAWLMVAVEEPEKKSGELPADFGKVN